MMTKLPTGFVPSSDQGYTNLSIELPPGSTLEDTLETAETVRKSVATIEGINNIFTIVGTAGENTPNDSSIGDLHKGSLILTFYPSTAVLLKTSLTRKSGEYCQIYLEPNSH